MVSSKYWKRANNRTNQFLHGATDFIVRSAAEGYSALAMEDLTGINRMYRRGNGQGPAYRFRLNSWPHCKACEMLACKSAWKGVNVTWLTKSETGGSSSTHTCGERLREPARGDVETGGCYGVKCNVWVDRDVNASIVPSERVLARFASSLPRQAARRLVV